MDQIKKFFAKAIQQRFWIMIGLAIVISGVAWFTTQSNLNKLYTDQETLIKNKYSDLEKVKSALPTHPNQSSKTEMVRIIGNLSTDVRRAWEEQYKRQEEYMKWPDIGLTRLVNKLKAYYPVELHSKLNYPDEPVDITEGEKTAFSKYFDEQMPKLAEIIGVTWVGTSSSATGAGGLGPGGMGPGGMGPGGMGMDSGGSDGRGDDGGMDSWGFGAGGFGGPGGASGFAARRPASRDVVIWPKASQDELLGSIRLWQGTKPTVYQMIYTQENIWILEGLLKIIAKTNIVPQTGKPASANVQAAVKQIEFIRIGTRAIGDAGDVMFTKPQAGGGIGMGMGMDSGSMGMDSGSMGMDGGSMGMDGGSMGMDGGSMGMDGGMSMGGREGGFGPGGMGMDGMAGGGSARLIDPANRRYVDATFQPISGEDFRTKIKSESPEDAYFAVAKRVPVRMRLTLDMRRFQEFLANCGNEGMMLEVRQVRLGNTSPAGTSSSMSGGFGGMMSGAGPGRGSASGPGGFGMDGPGSGSEDGAMGDFGDSSNFGMGPGGMGPGGMGPAGLGGFRPSRRATNEMKIEVYGIVYLFYPVNIDRLGLNKVDENFELKDSVETPAEPIPSTPANKENSAEGSANNESNTVGGANANGSGSVTNGTDASGNQTTSEGANQPGSTDPATGNSSESGSGGSNNTGSGN